jgi:hypothetical protein
VHEAEITDLRKRDEKRLIADMGAYMLHRLEPLRLRKA